MEKRSVLDSDKGPIIIKTQMLTDGQLVAELTAVDLYRGKNVSIGLGPREMATLLRHVRELRRARHSESAKEAYRAHRHIPIRIPPFVVEEDPPQESEG